METNEPSNRLNEALELNRFKVDTTDSPPSSIGNIGLDVVQKVSTE